MQKYWLNSFTLILILSFSTTAFSKQESFKTNATDQVSCSAARFNIVDLGSLDSTVQYRYVYGTQLNNSGNVVGTSTVPNAAHSFYYTNNGGMQDIHPNISDVTDSQARALNDQNHVVGIGGISSGSAGSSEMTFFYDQESIQQIARSDSPEFIEPADINDSDQILFNRSNYVGNAGQYSSYIWQNGQTISTFDVGGTPFLSRAMNNNRVIVGWKYVNYPTSYETRGFVWQNGQLRVLSILDTTASARGAEASNINNDSTVIVGDAFKSLSPMAYLQRPVFWARNNTGDYGVKDIIAATSNNQGQAHAVNNQRVVVGEMTLQNGSDRHAFLYDVPTNALVDLRTRVNYMGSRVLESAQDINDHCQILVNGRDPQGQPAVFRLDPIN